MTVQKPFIKNTSLDTIVTKAIADGTISYQELLDLFTTAVKSGITATELTDLQTIHTQLKGVFGDNKTRDYLTAMSYNVIFGNVSNETWWGGGQPQPLGNLQAGTSEIDAQHLVGKWFLGEDLPLPVASTDIKKAKSTQTTYQYQLSQGELIKDDVNASDIVQGKEATCYLLAALGSIANTDGALIKDSFIDNGNGTYGVRLYFNDQAFYTTVDLRLPTIKNTNQLVFAAGDIKKDLNGELWVSLLEKAYAQFNSQFNTQAFSNQEVGLLQLMGQSIDSKNQDAVNTSNWLKENSYAAIGNSFAQPIKQFTNLNYTYYSSYIQDTSLNDENESQVFYSKDPNTYKQTIINALDQGAIGWLAAYGSSTSDKNSKFNFYQNHAYMLLGYDHKTDQFLFRNPWGGGKSIYAYNIDFKVPIEYFWNKNIKAIIALSNPTAIEQKIEYTISPLQATKEGNNVELIITRDQADSPSTIYLSTSPQTSPNSADASDFEVLNKIAITFSKNELSKKITIKTYDDSELENTEYFNIELYSGFYDLAPMSKQQAAIEDATVKTDYVYKLDSSANSPSTAQTEGQAVKFTITRNATGSPSTVYISTLNGSANTDDYQSIEKMAVHFEQFEERKIVDVKTIADSSIEGIEDMSLAIYSKINDTTNIANSKAYISDTFLAPYKYSVISNADTLESASKEGDVVTFTIFRNSSGTPSTVYVSTKFGTADDADYQGVYKLPVYFAGNQTQATVNININQDLLLESDEYFTLDVYETSNATSYLTYAPAYIRGFRDSDVKKNDSGEYYIDTVTQPIYNYTISSNPDNGLVREGDEVTFTITRLAGDASAPSTVYLSTSGETADSSDYAALNKYRLDFNAYDISKTVKVKIYQDDKTETNERFWLDLYRNSTDTHHSSSIAVDIQDVATTAPYNYKVIPLSSSVNEGSPATFTIKRQSSNNISDSVSTVYLKTIGTADNTDYEAKNYEPLVFKPFENEINVQINTFNNDNKDESNKDLYLLLFDSYANALNNNVSEYGYTQIQKSLNNDNYTYTIKLDSPVIDEGKKLSVTIERSGNGNNPSSTIYLKTLDGNTDANDYSALSLQPLTFNDTETKRSIDIEVYNDNNPEGEEYFWLELFKTYTDALNDNYLTIDSINIKDAVGKTDYHYSIADSSVTEGSTITIIIERDHSEEASTVYVQTQPGTADESDYAALGLTAITFEANQTRKTLTLDTYSDRLTEGDEYFWLALFKNQADAKNGDWSAYGQVTIQDDQTLTDNYGYRIITTSPTLEGQNAVVTVTRNSSQKYSKVYYSTTNGTADEKDYLNTDLSALEFKPGEISKTISIPTYIDNMPEDNEYFWLMLFDTQADALNGNWSDFKYITISDRENINHYSYNIVGPSQVIEGEPITLNIVRNGSGTQSSIYYQTQSGTADASDFVEKTSTILKFDNNQTVQTITLQTKQDNVVEEDEYFWLQLFDSDSDVQNGNWSTAESLVIKDSQNSQKYHYSISSNSPVIEGKPITIIITRDHSGSPSTVYLNTLNATADNTDFSGLVFSPLEFQANETIKTVSLDTYSDKLSEGQEYFWLELFESQTDIPNDNWSLFENISIQDIF